MGLFSKKSKDILSVLKNIEQAARSPKKIRIEDPFQKQALIAALSSMQIPFKDNATHIVIPKHSNKIEGLEAEYLKQLKKAAQNIGSGRNRADTHYEPPDLLPEQAAAVAGNSPAGDHYRSMGAPQPADDNSTIYGSIHLADEDINHELDDGYGVLPRADAAQQDAPAKPKADRDKDVTTTYTDIPSKPHASDDDDNPIDDGDLFFNDPEVPMPVTPVDPKTAKTDVNNGYGGMPDAPANAATSSTSAAPAAAQVGVPPLAPTPPSPSTQRLVQAGKAFVQDFIGVELPVESKGKGLRIKIPKDTQFTPEQILKLTVLDGVGRDPLYLSRNTPISDIQYQMGKVPHQRYVDVNLSAISYEKSKNDAFSSMEPDELQMAFEARTNDLNYFVANKQAELAEAPAPITPPFGGAPSTLNAADFAERPRAENRKARQLSANQVEHALDPQNNRPALRREHQIDPAAVDAARAQYKTIKLPDTPPVPPPPIGLDTSPPEPPAPDAKRRVHFSAPKSREAFQQSDTTLQELKNRIDNLGDNKPETFKALNSKDEARIRIIPKGSEISARPHEQKKGLTYFLDSAGLKDPLTLELACKLAVKQAKARTDFEIKDPNPTNRENVTKFLTKAIEELGNSKDPAKQAIAHSLKINGEQVLPPAEPKTPSPGSNRL